MEKPKLDLTLDSHITIISTEWKSDRYFTPSVLARIKEAFEAIKGSTGKSMSVRDIEALLEPIGPLIDRTSIPDRDYFGRFLSYRNIPRIEGAPTRYLLSHKGIFYLKQGLYGNKKVMYNNILHFGNLVNWRTNDPNAFMTDLMFKATYEKE